MTYQSLEKRYSVSQIEYVEGQEIDPFTHSSNEKAQAQAKGLNAILAGAKVVKDAGQLGEVLSGVSAHLYEKALKNWPSAEHEFSFQIFNAL